MEKGIHIGSRVRLDARHWKRANALATITDFDGTRGDHHWLATFDDAFVGGGFDGGKLLWCNDRELVADDTPKRKA